MARYQPAEREARFRKARRSGLPVVVTEGDSWFDYPMYLNIVDRVDDAKRFALKRLEFSGDTVANMLGQGRKWSGLASLKVVVEHERPRFVLFSGGGNDIVGEEFKGAVRQYDALMSADWHIDTPVWHALQSDVEAAYQRLIETVGPLAPIFAHGYDYILPSNRAAKYDGISIAGPWVWPTLQAAGIPPTMMLGIGRLMIDWFNGMLAAFEVKYPEAFAHLDLRGTLRPEQWQNEIHPTALGFRAIADRFVSQLDKKLTTTLAAHDAVVMLSIR